MELAGGILITPKLRLVRPLGEGGMASVWAADHLAIDSQVAVKFLASRLIDEDPSMLDRFKAEAAVAAKIRSPHVVQIYDHGVVEGRPYIVMELMEGETLEARLRRRGAMSPPQVATVIDQVAKALTKAHALGVVHRDIKPANLFNVDGGYELFVKVLDFGIAKQSQLIDPDVITDEWEVAGTPEFMSPEQLQSSKHVDHRADLWALGVVAYALLSGELPFRAKTLHMLYRSIIRAEYRSIRRTLDGASPELEAWFEQALHVDREQRFQSANELASAFHEAIGEASGTVPARSASTFESPAHTVPLDGIELEAPTATEATPVPFVTRASQRLSRFTRRPVGRPLLWLAAATLVSGVLVGTQLLDADVPVAASSGDTWTQLGERAAVRAGARVESVPPDPPAAPRAAASAPATTEEPPPSKAVAPARPAQPLAPPPAASETQQRCPRDKAFYMDENGYMVPRPECL